MDGRSAGVVPNGGDGHRHGVPAGAGSRGGDAEVLVEAGAAGEPQPDGELEPGGVLPEPDPQGVEEARAAAAEGEGAGEPEEVDPIRTGFYGAVRLLEDVDDRRPINCLIVTYTVGVTGDNIRAFPRFVTLLGRRDASGGAGRAIRSIDLDGDWVRLPTNDVERLFRDALPAHPTLEKISINITALLHSRFMKLFMESLPTGKGNGVLPRLRLYGGGVAAIEREQHFQVILAMLNRNAALAALRIDFYLDADEGKRIVDALPRNTNLVDFSLGFARVNADTLEGVPASSLQSLEVEGFFSEDAVSSLAGQLRTNEKLVHLDLVDIGVGRRSYQPLLDLVKTYNYTLQDMVGNLVSGHGVAAVRDQFERYMSRNARIRDGLQELHDPRPLKRFVVPAELLPPVLGLVSDVPTALFRILRMEYVRTTVSDLLRDAYLAKTTATAAIEATGPNPPPPAGRQHRRRRQQQQSDSGRSKRTRSTRR